jgi:hypothetical protein
MPCAKQVVYRLFLTYLKLPQYHQLHVQFFITTLKFLETNATGKTTVDVLKTTLPLNLVWHD